MINKALDQIEKSDIERLISDEVREGRTIEYKESLCIGNDREKKEFLADISSFGNAGGGDILFGVREKRDEDGKSTGTAEAIPGLELSNIDETTLQIENIVRNGLSPRLDIKIHPVPGFQKGPVLIIRIPQSWNSPHMIKFKGSQHFYSRTSAGKYLLDVAELRTAFTQSDVLATKIDRFWTDRISKILAGQTPVPLREWPKLVLFFFPFISLSSTFSVELAQPRQYDEILPDPLGFSDSHHLKGRHNFDGYLRPMPSYEPGICNAYFQLYRSGIVEQVNAELLRPQMARGGKLEPFIPLTPIERMLIEAIQQALSFYREFDVPLPIGIRFGIFGIKGYKIIDPDRLVYSVGEDVLERDHLIFPDVLVQSFDDDIPQLLKPAFDALWQAGDWVRSENYDEQGNYKLVA